MIILQYFNKTKVTDQIPVSAISKIWSSWNVSETVDHVRVSNSTFFTSMNGKNTKRRVRKPELKQQRIKGNNIYNT